MINSKQIHFYVKILFIVFTVVINFSVKAANPISCEASLGALDINLISEVTNLSDGEAISNETFSKFSINEIAQAVILRVQKQEAKDLIIDSSNYENKISEVELDLFKKAEIMMFFNESIIDSIADRGFLNQHLSGSSSGSYAPKVRIKAEDSILGIKLGTSRKSLKLRPKSAFINIRENVQLTRKRFPNRQFFGDVAVVFNNRVKKRSLWAAYDTLSLGVGDGAIKKYPKLINLFRGTFFKGRITRLDDSFKNDRYYEALIFGELSFSDVDYFLVSSLKQASKLEKFGKPIFFLKKSYVKGRSIYRKGRLPSN